MHPARANNTLRTRQVEEGGSVDPWEWVGPSILQELVMRKVVDSGPRIGRQRPSWGLGGQGSPWACGTEASRAVGRLEVRFGMEWGRGAGLDSEGGGAPPGPWSPGGRRGTRAETFRSVSRRDHDSRVEALGPRG